MQMYLVTQGCGYCQWLNHKAARLPLRSRRSKYSWHFQKLNSRMRTGALSSASLAGSCQHLWYVSIFSCTDQQIKFSLQFFLNILASSGVTLWIHSYSNKFRSETLKMPICWFECAGNNAQTECLGYEELCQNRIIQWTENGAET